jgi:hypothetical protein
MESVCPWHNGKCVYVRVSVCVCVIPVLHKVRGVLGYTRKDLENPDPDVQVCVILEEVLYNTLSVSVGHRNDTLLTTTDLTRYSQGLHPLQYSCCEVKTSILSPFGVWVCPILIHPMVILRITHRRRLHLPWPRRYSVVVFLSRCVWALFSLRVFLLFPLCEG